MDHDNDRIAPHLTQPLHSLNLFNIRRIIRYRQHQKLLGWILAIPCSNTHKLDVTFQVQEIDIAGAFGERMGRSYLSVTSPMELGMILSKRLKVEVYAEYLGDG